MTARTQITTNKGETVTGREYAFPGDETYFRADGGRLFILAWAYDSMGKHRRWYEVHPLSIREGLDGDND